MLVDIYGNFWYCTGASFNVVHYEGSSSGRYYYDSVSGRTKEYMSNKLDKFVIIEQKD